MHIKKLILVLSLLFAVILTSCAQDSTSKRLLCDTLNAPYSAEADFTFSQGQNTVNGQMRISSTDNIRIDFLTPDSLGGICIQSDASGQMSDYIVSFQGIKSEISKDILSKLSLCFELLSRNTPMEISKLASSGFAVDENSEKCTASFQKGDINYSVIYNTSNGFPEILIASTKDHSATLTFTKFKSNLQTT